MAHARSIGKDLNQFIAGLSEFDESATFPILGRDFQTWLQRFTAGFSRTRPPAPPDWTAVVGCPPERSYIFSYSSPAAGKTVCLGAGEGASPFSSHQRTWLRREALAASGREKSILVDSIAPRASRLFVS